MTAVLVGLAGLSAVGLVAGVRRRDWLLVGLSAVLLLLFTFVLAAEPSVQAQALAPVALGAVVTRAPGVGRSTRMSRSATAREARRRVTQLGTLREACAVALGRVEHEVSARQVRAGGYPELAAVAFIRRRARSTTLGDVDAWRRARDLLVSLAVVLQPEGRELVDAGRRPVLAEMGTCPRCGADGRLRPGWVMIDCRVCGAVLLASPCLEARA